MLTENRAAFTGFYQVIFHKKTIPIISHICFTANDINILYTRKIVSHQFFSSFMTVWMMCSSMPLKKEISIVPVLIVQVGLGEIPTDFFGEDVSSLGCSETGTIVSFCCGI